MTPCAFVLIKTKPYLTSVHPTMCVCHRSKWAENLEGSSDFLRNLGGRGPYFLDKKFSTVSKSRSRQLRNFQQFQNSSLDSYLRLKFQVSIFNMVLIESFDLDSFNKNPVLWQFYKHVKKILLRGHHTLLPTHPPPPCASIAFVFINCNILIE